MIESDKDSATSGKTPNTRRKKSNDAIEIEQTSINSSVRQKRIARAKRVNIKKKRALRSKKINTSKENVSNTGKQDNEIQNIDFISQPESYKISAQTSKWRNKLWLSFFILVILPFLISIYYFCAVSTDRYASRAGFSIRGIDTNTSVDALGALTGLASTGSTTADSYVVMKYLTSRELLEAVDKKHDLRTAFSSTKIDYLSRLREQASIEDFLLYWKKRIRTEFDPTSGIVEFEVQSFDPAHAQSIAAETLRLTQKLVNDLSLSARSDSLKAARAEVIFQEARLHKALSEIRDFRTSEQLVDPSASASLEIQLIADLQSRLTDVRARISTLSQTLENDAPRIKSLMRLATALEGQLTERRRTIGNKADQNPESSEVAKQLALYDELEVERSLAQQVYSSALVSLEQARNAADRQQRYLAVHLKPQIAEAAEYPRSLRNLFVIFFALLASWGIGALLACSVRDHLT